MKILIALLAGLGIFLIIKIVRIILSKLIQKYSFWKRVQKVFPVFEVIIWIIYIFWGAGLLFKDRIYYSYTIIGMMLVVIGLIAWFFLRDVFAGALFKMQNDLNQGDYIKVGDISGQIKSLGLTHLEIISDSGQTVKIPNTRLNRDLISSTTTPDGMEEFNIRLSCDKKFTKPEIEEIIKEEVANSPWCNYKNPPIIKFQSEDETTYIYDVLIYTLNHQHLRMVEKDLKAKFEKQGL